MVFILYGCGAPKLFDICEDCAYHVRRFEQDFGAIGFNAFIGIKRDLVLCDDIALVEFGGEFVDGKTGGGLVVVC